MNKREDISWLWNIVFVRKIMIGVVVCVALVYLVTLPVFIKPLYESETIVYVPLTILNQQLSQQGIGFGGEHEVDSYIQILKSNTLADSLIKRFGLKENNQQRNSQLYKELESRIKIEKTRYSSVSIKVQDNNPEKAAAMANSIVALGEIIKQHLFNPNRMEAMLYSKSLYTEKVLEVAALEKKLDSIGKQIPSPWAKSSWMYDGVTSVYKLELQELISRKNQYEHAQKDFDTPLPKAYVVSYAVAADKPERPNRWVICMIGVIGYLFLIIVLEIIKRDIKKEPQ